MSRLLVIALIALFPVSSSFAEEAPAASAEIDHAPFHKLLKANVKGTKVNYKGFKQSAEFKAYVALIGKTDPAKLSSRNARLAFWINAYNALTINGVLQYYPKIKSVLKVTPDFFKSKTRVVGGKKMALNDIENNIVRPTFKDPRIHAALNCASVSCPPLANFAFTPKGLNGQLNKVFRKFANDTSRNQIDPAAGTVKLSMIFKWYGDDFKKDGGPAKYIAKFVKDEGKKKALTNTEKVDFLAYDWNLNKL